MIFFCVFGFIMNSVSHMFFSFRSLFLHMRYNFALYFWSCECRRSFWSYIRSILWKGFRVCVLQRSVSITQETPRGGGLDSFPNKDTYVSLDGWFTLVFEYILEKSKTSWESTVMTGFVRFSRISSDGLHDYSIFQE